MEIQYFNCPSCGQQIPIGNRMIHELRCKSQKLLTPSEPSAELTDLNHTSERSYLEPSAPFENHADDVTVCDESIVDLTSSPSPENRRVSLRDDVWACQRCTFAENNLNSTECEVCGTSNVIARDDTSPMLIDSMNNSMDFNDSPIGNSFPHGQKYSKSSQPTTSQQDRSHWECGTCTYVNSVNENNCVMCGNYRPAQNSYSEQLIQDDDHDDHIPRAIPINDNDLFTEEDVILQQQMLDSLQQHQQSGSSRGNHTNSNWSDTPQAAFDGESSINSALLGAGVGATLAWLNNRSVAGGALTGASVGLLGNAMLQSAAAPQNENRTGRPSRVNRPYNASQNGIQSDFHSDFNTSSGFNTGSGSGGGGGGHSSYYDTMMRQHMEERNSHRIAGNQHNQSSSSSSSSSRGGHAALSSGSGITFEDFVMSDDEDDVPGTRMRLPAISRNNNSNSIRIASSGNNTRTTRSNNNINNNRMNDFAGFGDTFSIEDIIAQHFGQEAFPALPARRTAARGGMRPGYYGGNAVRNNRRRVGTRQDLLEQLMMMGVGGFAGMAGDDIDNLSYEQLLERFPQAPTRHLEEQQLQQLPSRIFGAENNSSSSGSGVIDLTTPQKKPPAGSASSDSGSATAAASGSGGKEAESCAICMEEYAAGEELKTLPCLHAYHAHCIESWLRQSHVCPVCKFSLLE